MTPTVRSAGARPTRRPLRCALLLATCLLLALVHEAHAQPAGSAQGAEGPVQESYEWKRTKTLVLKVETPWVQDTVRELYEWSADRRLLIGTINAGLFTWQEADAAPRPTALSTGRVLAVHERGSQLWIGSEKGLFRWSAGAPDPELVAPIAGGAYEIVDWNEDLVVRGGEGLHFVPAGGGAVRRIAKNEKFVWFGVSVWAGQLVYHNLQGLHVLASPDAAPVDSLADSGGIDWHRVYRDVLLVGTRSNKTLALRRGVDPVVIGPAPGFFRGALEWDDALYLGTDGGLWRVDSSCSGITHVSGVKGSTWGSMLVLFGDLVIGTTDGLFRWRRGAPEPEQVLAGELTAVQSLYDWNGTLVFGGTLRTERAVTLGFWYRGDERPTMLPAAFSTGTVDFLHAFRGGLVLGFYGKSMGFIDPEMFKKGHIELAQPSRLPVNQPVYITWKITGSPVAAVPGLVQQDVRLLGPGGALIKSEPVQERNHKGNAEFEMVLPGVSNPGKYQIEVVARLPMKNELTKQIPLLVGDEPSSFDLATFMGWRRPKTAEELGKAISLNLGVAAAFYYAAVLLLFALWPERLVAWYEALSSGKLPGSGAVAKFAVPWLITTDRCLDAVVARHAARAQELFEQVPDVKNRPRWVPAPLRIAGQLVREFKRPAQLAPEATYTPALFELRRELAGQRARFIVSIEGPGGVGKSALGFPLARWAASELPATRLRAHRMLPVLVDDPGKSVDEALREKLRFMFNAPRISDVLFESLLRRGRVLAVVDSASEKPEDVLKVAIRPEKGATHTGALVVTSRLATQLPDAVVLTPQALTLAFLDAFLDDIIAGTLGAGRFSGPQRETIRGRLISLMNDLGSRGAPTGEIPVLFVTLMVGQAHQLAVDERSDLSALPHTVFGLVDAYVDALLRDQPDPTVAIGAARCAAVACLGVDLVPALRPRHAYQAEGVSPEDLRIFVAAGLLVTAGSTGDPLYKFSLDPVSEALAAREWAVRLRDGITSDDELRARLRAAGQGAAANDFATALDRATQAALGRRFAWATQTT